MINTLKGKKTCNVAPIPGETKIWQYVTLMRRVFLIDCPGVVYHHTEDNEADSVLKGVVRVENLAEPMEFAHLVIARVKRQYLQRTYKVEWESDNPDDFLEAMARRYGKLRKGGDPDVVASSKMLLNDWQRSVPHDLLGSSTRQIRGRRQIRCPAHFGLLHAGGKSRGFSPLHSKRTISSKSRRRRRRRRKAAQLRRTVRRVRQELRLTRPESSSRRLPRRSSPTLPRSTPTRTTARWAEIGSFVLLPAISF